MTTEIAKLLAEKAPLPKGTHIVSRIGGRAVGGTHELKDFVLAGANRVPNHISEDEPFWIHGWRDLHDELSIPGLGWGNKLGLGADRSLHPIVGPLVIEQPYSIAGDVWFFHRFTGHFGAIGGVHLTRAEVLARCEEKVGHDGELRLEDGRWVYWPRSAATCPKEDAEPPHEQEPSIAMEVERAEGSEPPDVPRNIHFALYKKSDDPEHADNRNSREFLDGGEALNYSAPSSFAAPAGSDASPWPLRDIVSKLVEASDILLDEKDYDGHGWELISGARREAKEWLRQNSAFTDGGLNDE